MARVIDQAGDDVQTCASCGVNHVEEGITCPNARDLCIDCCGESH